MKIPGTPSIIPLLELAEHTDQVVIESLGLPQGFDESQLSVNLAAFSRVQKLSGIDIQADGTAALGLGNVIRARPKTGDGTIGMFDENPLYIRHVDATVVLQEDAIAQQLQRKGPRAAFSGRERASALNNGLRHGLRLSNIGANMDVYRASASLIAYGASSAPAFASYETSVAIPVTLLTAQILNFGVMSQRRDSIVESARKWRKSLFFGISPDRALAGAAAIASSKFIVANTAKN